MNYTVSAIKDKGKIRDSQQDSLLVLPYNIINNGYEDIYLPDLPNVFIVADGMGGTSGGEIASKIAVAAIKNYFSNKITQSISEPEALLHNAIQLANKHILEFADSHHENRNMGSTIVLSLIFNNKIHICWVGDSRCYGINKHSGKIIQLTKDHSFVQTLIDEGKIDKDTAIHHPNRNLITRSLGMDKVISDYKSYDLDNFSHIYICSDGVNSMIEDVEIEQIINQIDDVSTCNKAIVQAALEAGGDDNISSILLSFSQPISIESENKPLSEINYNKIKTKKKIIHTKIFLLTLSISLGLLFIALLIPNENLQLLFNNLLQTQSIDSNLTTIPQDTSKLDKKNNYTDTQEIKNNPYVLNDTISKKDSSNINSDEIVNYEYYIRIGIFSQKNMADSVLNKFNKLIFDYKVIKRKLDKNMYEVCIINILTKKEAQEVMNQYKIDGIIIVKQND